MAEGDKPTTFVRPLDPQVRVGHVHLKVSDLERSLEFYCGVLGFELTQRYGQGAAFVSAGGYHHHIGLNTWESLGGSPPAAGTTGLYHLAIVYPTRASLADALRRVIAARIPLDGASDHGRSGCFTRIGGRKMGRSSGSWRKPRRTTRTTNSSRH